MELKQYQQDTLNDLAAYMQQVSDDNDLRKAYTNFWLKKGIDISTFDNNRFIHSYDNSTVPGVPRVMFKVPTAGGKTFIAANALKVIFDHLPAEHPKVVAWFVPSDPILQQTYKNLSNPLHPYRQRINTHFNNRVTVVDKETALSGTGIQPGQIQEQVTIFVLTVQSFATSNKDGRRAFRENSSLAAYAKWVNDGSRVKDADETSLIQAIASLNPVVIIDESHNFGSDMRVDALTQINPSFILDLTATPREKSNIISFVDAKKLKDANMVKLPVVLYNRNSIEDVIFSAKQLQESLEKRALALREKGGHYIRPIVLFQAQPRGKDDNETFEKVKQRLVEAGIPEAQIKIKTGEKDEIKNIDLMSDTCEVRYIITVNALKEGWDCPFAYILASLANKTSQIDVEQIVGRVLRLPYTTKHADELLNMSYVFTSSNDFRQTVESVIAGLNKAGFSPKDTRIAEEMQVEAAQDAPVKQVIQQNIFDNSNNDADSADNEFDVAALKARFENAASAEAQSEIDAIVQSAILTNEQYENDNKENNDSLVPSEIRSNVKTYKIKPDFIDAAQLQLPVFMMKVNNNSIFHPEGEFIPLTKKMLTEGFVLENADRNVNFSGIDKNAVFIDLEKRAEDEYVPKQYKIDDRIYSVVRETFVGYGIESKCKELTGKVAKRLHFDEVNEPHISNYIKSVLANKSDEELIDLFDRENDVKTAFETKIKSLIAEYQCDNFNKLINRDLIKCASWYSFPREITIGTKAIGLPKGLYIEEDGGMNNLEYPVISAVANLDNVLFWHRNPQSGKNGFCINGFENHYPDFIIKTKKGKIVILETKGDDRDNSNTKRKIEMGKKWADMAGDAYFYFMVFENAQMQGASTLSDFLDALRYL
ncbi:MAG: DEAD/DEAH box helicase family protein [Salinivirgaceae bacterium]|nr:DEAD/DEAH box helicase family protein [Salinivirgaceae bacterium]